MKVDAPDGWAPTQISEIVDRLQYGYTAKACPNVDGPKFLRITDISDQGVKWGTVPSCTITAGDLEKYRLQDGDLVFARSGSIEKAWRVQDCPDSVFASYLIRGTPVIADLGPWLEKFVKSREYLSQIGAAAAGIGMANVNAKKLGSIRLPLPPLNEQRRIVAKIEALMARSARAREALDAIPALLDRYRQSVLAAAFRGDLTADWRERHPDVEPASTQYLADLISDPIRNGLSVRGTDTPPGMPALRLSALRSSLIDMEDVRYLQVGDVRAGRYLLREGDVLISRGNGTRSLVGRSSLVSSVPRPTIFPDTAFRVRIDPLIADPAWLALVWNALQVRAQIERRAKTTAGIWKVSQADLATVMLRTPPLKEQQEIVIRVNLAFTLIDVVEQWVSQSTDRLAVLDQSILAKAFRGELVPQDPNDEPASVLLARIKAERAANGSSSRGRRRRTPGADHR